MFFFGSEASSEPCTCAFQHSVGVCVCESVIVCVFVNVF